VLDFGNRNIPSNVSQYLYCYNLDKDTLAALVAQGDSPIARNAAAGAQWPKSAENSNRPRRAKAPDPTQQKEEPRSPAVPL
jgi:hypothetical protein